MRSTQLLAYICGTHTENILTHQTPILHPLLSHIQTADRGCRNGCNRLAFPQRGCMCSRSPPPVFLLMSLGIGAPGCCELQTRQMLANQANGRSVVGVEMTCLWFPCPVAHSCHTRASNMDDRETESVHCPSALFYSMTLSSTMNGCSGYCNWTSQTDGRNRR